MNQAESARKRRILIVDDDPGVHLSTKSVLKQKYECASAYTCDEALALVRAKSWDLVLVDLNLDQGKEGLQLVSAFKEIDPDLDVVMVSSETELQNAVEAVKRGASSYVVKEEASRQLPVTVEIVMSLRDSKKGIGHLESVRKRALDRDPIVGSTPAMKKLLEDIAKVSRSTVNAIIHAETGCGKELVARHIGATSGKPFISVDSATITGSMAESILFGHEKGAFTGANARTKGLFEEADGGTIYFDEIANMPLEIQAKLLRVLQEKEVVRLGSSRPIPLEFRVICATNRDLAALSAKGGFLPDLLQRLDVVTLMIAPLRERIADLSEIAKHLFKKYSTANGPTSFSEDAMSLLKKYSWPGNVRELSNLIANLCTMVEGKAEIEPEDLPEKIRDHASKPPVLMTETGAISDVQDTIRKGTFDMHEWTRAKEAALLGKLYGAYEGNVSRLAKDIRMSRSHLYAKLKAYEILKPGQV